jgi:hypothetical protein
MPIPKTVATCRVKSTHSLRPSARPANREVMPRGALPGAHLSPKTVARSPVKPRLTMRPRAPGQADVDGHKGNAGRALFHKESDQ